MPAPFDDLANLSHTYAAEDFMAQRKRLREARARWIDEHECPKPLTVVHTDENGKVVGETAAGGPFEVGKLTYDGEWTPDKKNITFIPQPDAADVEDLGKNLATADAFLAPGIYRESPHPEIREGEDYGEYCARVAREYEAATGKNAVRRPVPDSDGVRESPAVDTGGLGGPSAPGASDSERGGSDPDSDSLQDSTGESGSARDDAGSADPTADADDSADGVSAS